LGHSASGDAQLPRPERESASESLHRLSQWVLQEALKLAFELQLRDVIEFSRLQDKGLIFVRHE
jgi:hypothetical protein